jgi:hypothetical protein
MQPHLSGAQHIRKRGNDRISSTGHGRSILTRRFNMALAALVRPSSSGAELVAREEPKQGILRGDLTHPRASTTISAERQRWREFA